MNEIEQVETPVPVDTGGEEYQEAVRARASAWVTAAVLSLLWLLSTLPKLGYAGFGIFAFPFFILLSIIGMLLSRFMLQPLYKMIWNKRKRPALRRIALVIVGLTVIFALYAAWDMAYGPSPGVRKNISKIPVIKEYFWKNKEMLESERIAAGGDHFEKYDEEKSKNLVTVSFCYEEHPEEIPKTGLVHFYEYIHRLDEHWYIRIYLHPAI